MSWWKTGHGVDLVDGIAGLAEMMALPETPEAPESSPRDPEASVPMASEEERVAHRAQTLADDARVRAFEIIGERERAVAIMERRLLAD